jgi:hypothetical protein
VTHAAACQNHPQREAIGICVKCRNRVCSECVTKVDGINYCVACLASLAHAAAAGRHRERARASGSPLVGALAAFGWLVMLTLLAWGLVEAAMPGSGG